MQKMQVRFPHDHEEWAAGRQALRTKVQVSAGAGGKSRDGIVILPHDYPHNHCSLDAHDAFPTDRLSKMSPTRTSAFHFADLQSTLG